jgi:uncharacterized membrane protein
VNEWLNTFLSLVCGQNPAHLWAPGGLALPCCQRCAGLYCGALAAFVCLRLFRPALTTRFLWGHGLLLVQMVPLGFHWVAQGPVLRTVSGVLFAFGLAVFLELVPGGPWRTVARVSPWAARAYWLGVAISTALILALAREGGRGTAVCLSIMIAAGALTLFWLAAVNVLMLASGLWPKPGRTEGAGAETKKAGAA